MKKFRRGVFIVAYRQEKEKILYLLLKRKLHWTGWEFPKGGINSGENLIKAVKRELKEETGQVPIKIKKYSIKGSYKYARPLKDRPGIIGQTYVLFSAELSNKKIKIDKGEHSSYKWTDYKTAESLLTFPNKKRCLKIVNKKLLNTFK